MTVNQITARRVLWETILHNQFPTRVLGAELSKHNFPAQDHAFARELLSGSIRWQLTLDTIVNAHTQGRVRNQYALSAIRLGLYQLLFMDSVAEYAAINETINAAKPELGKETKFVNAVLRSVVRGIVSGKSKLGETHSFAARNVVFAKAIFADPKQQPQLAAAQQFSFPLFLVNRWWQEVGEEKCMQRLHNLNKPAPLWRRMNLCKSSVKDAGVCQPFKLEAGEAIHQHPGFESGEWAIQDITSFETAMYAEASAGSRILDLCAAPGGKTFAIAEHLNGEAEFHACDISEQRLETMQIEGGRLGHDINYHHISEDGDGLPGGSFDLVICDVPCSNTGVLNKRAEARHRFSKKYLHEIETVQNVFRKKVLAKVVDENTNILYSTCSLEPEENQAMAARIAKAFSKSIIRQQTVEPDGERAGGYMALIK